MRTLRGQVGVPIDASAATSGALGPELLLGAGIPICEHLTKLDQLTGTDEFFHGAPVAWRGGATFPVRAYVLRG